MTRIVQEVLSKQPKKGRLNRRSTRPAIRDLKLDSYADILQHKKEEPVKSVSHFRKLHTYTHNGV